MVQVNYYETATMRKTGKMKEGEICGTLYVNIEPEEIPEVSEKLKGITTADGRDMYEVETERREERIEKAIFNCKAIACDKVRELIGTEGVLVASIPQPEEKTEEK